jgi:UDP-N-acetyl-2-amino-2-deoxyglucuronate dehydrogenase
MKNFALIGAAGYIAPRHLKAIKDTGNSLVAAFDPFDSVGVLDSYFPEADFFTEFERFDRHLQKLRRQNTNIDYVTVCSPNYLHDAHIRFGLRHGADVICEKPLVLNPWNVDALAEIEEETGGRVYTILQLRIHPSVIALREMVAASPADKRFDVALRYITSRGKWYHYSWKGVIEKSGGIATNIGVHFFDMLTWVFGPVRSSTVEMHTNETAAGRLELERADVDWRLSIDESELPESARANGSRTYRSTLIDGQEFDFSDGFTDLHTKCYEGVLSGGGFGLSEVRPVIELVHAIRGASGRP